jgi:hypothetical protein
MKKLTLKRGFNLGGIEEALRCCVEKGVKSLDRVIDRRVTWSMLLLL